jgi:hypothetical protein
MQIRTPVLSELLHLTFHELLDTAPELTRSVPIPTLPYWLSYEEWTAHLECCAKCSILMCLGDGSPERMCVEGQAYAEALRWDIDTQADVSMWN